jgi:hypothetical protein
MPCHHDEEKREESCPASDSRPTAQTQPVARVRRRGDRPPSLNCVGVWKIWGDKEFLSLSGGKK